MIADNTSTVLNEARRRFNYDPETGALTWKVAIPYHPHTKTGGRVGSISDQGYLRLLLCGRYLPAHRVIWLHYYGKWPEHHIDHINGIKDDNRIANLRDVTNTINQQNVTRPHRDNKLGVLGVSMRYGRFRSQIEHQGRKIYLGKFDTPEEAHAAYLVAKRKLHEGCTI